MQLKPPKKIARSCDDREMFESLLGNELDDKRILDIGCGKAKQTREIATGGVGRRVLALEVDQVQHEKNLVDHKDLLDNNVEFLLGGAERIPAEAETFDVVFMFKSLHHVPLNLMDRALSEVHRLLKPEGLAYISEPIWDGPFCCDVLSSFHDEEAARQAAFDCIQRAVGPGGLFVQKDEQFFDAPRVYESWNDFKRKTVGVTHTTFDLDEAKLAGIKREYSKHADPKTGASDFYNPMRVDLLQKK